MIKLCSSYFNKTMSRKRDKHKLFRSNSTNTTMAEKIVEIHKNMEGTKSGELTPDAKPKKKKFSRAMSFDVRALTSALKNNNDPSPTLETSKSVSPRPKKTYADYQHPSSSNSDIEEELVQTNYSVQYLGHVELKSPGLNEIIETVNKMYHHAKPYLKSLEKSLLTLNRDGITIKQYGVPRRDVEEEESLESEILYKPRRILYCGVDKQHQRVFSFNYQFGARAENIQLHVLVCKTKDDARHVAKYLAQLFKRISTDMHRKEKEDKKQHQEGLTKLKARSNQNIHTYANITYPTRRSMGSKDGSCSGGTCGSGEWMAEKERERIELSMA